MNIWDSYRKAKKGEVACRDCENSRRPSFEGKRLRCYLAGVRVVAKGNTCSFAETRKPYPGAGEER